MSQPAKACSLAEQKFASPELPVLSVARSVENDSYGAFPTHLGHYGSRMGVVVLNLKAGDFMYFSIAFGLMGGDVQRVLIAYREAGPEAEKVFSPA